jgi:GT2 family glycosyltransferase
LTPVMRAVFDARVHNQTSYDTIVDSDDVSYRYFWTCHVSLRRSFLLAHGLFDEQFRWAYGEDTELAYRLIRHGLRILFRREIAVTHDHLPSYTSARRRQRIAGEVACLMARKHPELVDLRFVHLSPKSRAMNWMKRRVVETAIDPLLDLADRRRWELPLLTRAYRWVLDEHQLWGLLDALAATGDAPIMPVVT